MNEQTPVQPITVQPTPSLANVEIEKEREETKQLEAGAVEAEKTKDGFKIRFKWWTIIFIIFSATACAIALKKFGVI
jgi:NADH:ubiquinone oxidoreductase subunit 3 (subunit A)